MRRATIGLGVGVGCALALAHTGASRGGPAPVALGDWHLNEVVTAGAGGDASVRFVELYTAADACWFPSTRVDAYDAAGHPLGSVAPFVATTCFAADSYVVLATPEAAQAFGFTPDVAMVPVLPAAAGQLCFASSTTIYDCVRWGAVTAPVHDFLGASDDSSAIAPPGGIALARTQITHVVAADWSTMSPTPRGPNDGTPWIPPDAGVDAPPADAAIMGPDADPADAAVDAGPPPDARFFADAHNHTYLGLDPGGGACACAGGGRGGAGSVLVIVLAIGMVIRPRAC